MPIFRRKDKRQEAPQLEVPMLFNVPAFAASERLVDEGQVLSIASAGFCLDRICNAVANMGPIYEVDEITERRTGVDRLVLKRPWTGMRSYEYLTMMVRSLIMRGDFFGIPTDYDSMLLLPQQIIPLHPDHVRLRFNDVSKKVDVYIRGRLYDGPLFHIAGPRMPGDLHGMGVVERYRRTHARNLDQEAYDSNSLRTGGVPTMTVKTNVPEPTQVQLDALDTAWQTVFGGGARKPAFLPKGFEVEPLSWSPADLEFLEGRRFSVAETALMFGFDPAYIGAAMSSSGTTQVYTNVQDRNQDLLRYTYGPWVNMIEEAFSELLPVGRSAQLDSGKLLRLTEKDRYESYKIASEAGFMLKSEMRAREGLDPVEGIDDVQTSNERNGDSDV